MGVITFAGYSSKDCGITVEGFSKPKIPKRRVTQYTVPGRNGTVDIDEGTWENVTQSYTVHWRTDLVDGPMESLALWMAAKGYQKLEDDFWPNHYRLARLDGDFEIDNRNNVLGRCKLAFDCRPEWYRKNVEDITIVNDYTASTVFNPTSNTATPVIVLRLNQAAAMGGISIGSNKVTLDMSNAESLPDDMTVVFDCDSRNAWSLDGTENLNQWVVVNGDYPSFSPGENTVSMDSSVVSCTITPRWWDLTP